MRQSGNQRRVGWQVVRGSWMPYQVDWPEAEPVPEAPEPEAQETPEPPAPDKEKHRWQGPSCGAPVPGDSITPLVHLYRAEVARGDVWRQRMDATTNWAIGATAATISVGFSHADVPHLLIPLGGVLVFLLMCIEGRRYRFYDVWRSRTRLMEAHFFVPYLMYEHKILQGRWRQDLAEDLLLPAYKMSFWRATGSRLRRNYIWIFLLLLVAWLLRILAQENLQGGAFDLLGTHRVWALYDRFGMGRVPAWMVLTATGLFYIGLLIWTFAAGRAEDPEVFVYRRIKRKLSAWPI